MSHNGVSYQIHTPQPDSPTSPSQPLSYNGHMYGPHTHLYSPYTPTYRFPPDLSSVSQCHYYAPPYPQANDSQHMLLSQPPARDVTSDETSYNLTGGSSFYGVSSGRTSTAKNQVSHRHPSSTNRNGTQTGPIKASRAVVVSRDSDGTAWITIEYTKDRVIKSHSIRIDIDTVDMDALSHEFKEQNVVYPAVFKGERNKREKYENECNRTAWALAKLNPVLSQSKGLRQRAVDGYRNSNPDRTKASRRVRRESKKIRRLQTSSKASANNSNESENPHAARTLPEHAMQDVPSSTTLSYPDFSHASNAPRYMPLTHGTNQNFSTRANISKSGKQQFKDGYTTPMTENRSTFPPTPETPYIEAERESSNAEDTSTPVRHVSQRRPSPYKDSMIQSFSPTGRTGIEHFSMNMDADGSRDIFNVNDVAGSCVFPRAVKGPSSGIRYNSDAELSESHSNVRISLGSTFAQVITVPIVSPAQHRSEREWNERATELIRTQYPDLRSRPHVMQRTLTQMYRKGKMQDMTSSEIWAKIPNRPGAYPSVFA